MTTSSSTTAATTQSVPLPFRRADDEPAFPLGGAVFLLALLAIAAWTWWTARRRGFAPLRPAVLGRWRPAPGAARAGDAIRVVDSARVDGDVRLHVVEWRQRRYLIAFSATGAPVVVDRDDAPGSKAENA